MAWQTSRTCTAGMPRAARTGRKPRRGGSRWIGQAMQSCARSSAHEAVATERKWWNSAGVPLSNPSAMFDLIETAARRS